MGTQPMRYQSDIDKVSSHLWHSDMRGYALFTTALYTGRHLSGLVRLDVGDVALRDDSGRLAMRERLLMTERGGKVADIVLHARTRRALSKYLRPRRKETAGTLDAFLTEPLFTSRKSRRDGTCRLSQMHAMRIIKTAARAVGIGYEIDCHTLRRTFGYVLYQNEARIGAIRRLLGFATDDETLDYIGIASDEMDDAILSM